MRKVFLLIIAVVALNIVSLKAQTVELAYLEPDDEVMCADMSESAEIEIDTDGINKTDCTFTKDGHTYKLYGKIKIVESFPDIKVQIVESFPDVDIQIVDSFPDSCGKVKLVESFPETKVQIVNSFPDIKVRLVNSFPGVK